jgi:hypothetical protein
MKHADQGQNCSPLFWAADENNPYTFGLGGLIVLSSLESIYFDECSEGFLQGKISSNDELFTRGVSSVIFGRGLCSATVFRIYDGNKVLAPHCRGPDERGGKIAAFHWLRIFNVRAPLSVPLL